MNAIEVAQDYYLNAMAYTREAAVEHARARMELFDAERFGANIDIAVIEMRSALATKLWETCLRREAARLEEYNACLLKEVQRLQEGAEPPLSASTEGHHFCFATMTPRD